jgi:hypothetical protein
VLRDVAGKEIADDDFVQWLENGRLHVRIIYAGRTRRIEESPRNAVKVVLLNEANEPTCSSVTGGACITKL